MTTVKGHSLVNEGAAFTLNKRRIRWNGTGGEGYGFCSCGVSSPRLPTAAARRRWHNEHKYALAEAG